MQIENPQRIDFDRCFFVSELKNDRIECALELHDQSQDLEIHDMLEITIDLLRKGIPIVSAHDREPIADQLDQFFSFMKNERPVRFFPGEFNVFFYRFTSGKNYLIASRLAQGLMLVRLFVVGQAVIEGFNLKGLNEKLDFHFSFLNGKQFKASFTSRFFQNFQAFGEAVIPKGEFLTLSTSAEKVRLESGTTLRFRAVRFFDSEGPYRRKKGFVFADAGTESSEAPLLIKCDQPVVFDPKTLDENSSLSILGSIPMHWITKVQTEEEHLGPVD